MLYVTTRNKKETYTVYKTLIAETAPDGGSFYPFKLPVYSANQIRQMETLPFNQILADVLNAFFSAKLTGWDIDFCIGKNPMRLLSMNYRVFLSELWHNPVADFAYITKRIYARLLGKEPEGNAPDWVCTVVRIATLFAVYGQLCAQGYLKSGEGLDLAVSGDGFEAPMAAYYARKMGLPVNTVICVFDNDSSIWELIHRGTFGTAAASDAAKCGVEKLISAALGEEALQSYFASCEKGRAFTAEEERLSALSDGFYCVVTGKDRAISTVNSVYRSNNYVMDPVTALSYGSLQDYRASTGNSALTLLLSERSPEHALKEIAKVTGVTEQKLLDQVKHRGE